MALKMLDIIFFFLGSDSQQRAGKTDLTD
jgi:hypothetical protein